MTIVNVSNSTQLNAALLHARGGETIVLAHGNYGDIRLDNVDFGSNVTIKSARPHHPATFTGLDLNNVSNLTVAGVRLDYSFHTGDPSYIAPFSITDGAHVSIRNSVFNGSHAYGVSADANGYGYGTGLSVINARDVHVKGNEMFNFFRGMTVSDSSDVTIARTNMHGIRSDGMDFQQVHGVTIAHNHIHDFRTSPDSADHPDMIQFWTAGSTAPSTDITIRGNFLDSGRGTWTQSIFMGNELAGQGTDMYYRNIKIANNVIVNGQYHGITVGQSIGVSITNNSVLHSDGNTPDGRDSGVEIPHIYVMAGSSLVQISHNLTGGVTASRGQSDWAIGHNMVVQDQYANEAHYYSDLFTALSLQGQNGSHNFLAIPGGVIDLAGVGASATRDYSSMSLSGTVLVADGLKSSGGGGARVYAEAPLKVPYKAASVAAEFDWNFNQGTPSRWNGAESSDSSANAKLGLAHSQSEIELSEFASLARSTDAFDFKVCHHTGPNPQPSVEIALHFPETGWGF